MAMLRFKVGEHAKVGYVATNVFDVIGPEVIIESVGPWPAHTLYDAIVPEGSPYRVLVHSVDYVIRFGSGPYAGRMDAAHDEQLIKLIDPDQSETTEELEELMVVV